MEAFNLHNEEFAEKVSKKIGKTGALLQYQRLEKKTWAFLMKKYHLHDLLMDDLQPGFAANFFHYLLMDDIGENTAMKYVKTLKQLIERAVLEGWIRYNPLKEFKCTYKDPERECLERHEIMRPYNKPITLQRLAEIQDR